MRFVGHPGAGGVGIAVGDHRAITEAAGKLDRPDLLGAAPDQHHRFHADISTRSARSRLVSASHTVVVSSPAA